MNNENLNLCKLLKNEIGKQFYSVFLGEVELIDINSKWLSFTGKLTDGTDGHINVYINGRYSDNTTEIVLYPSRENRDWTTFKPTIPDFPINTPVMYVYLNGWEFGYYAGDGKVFACQSKNINRINSLQTKHIVPVSEFNFEDLDSNKSKSI